MSPWNECLANVPKACQSVCCICVRGSFLFQWNCVQLRHGNLSTTTYRNRSSLRGTPKPFPTCPPVSIPKGGGEGGCSTKGGNSGSSPLRIRTRSYQEVKAYHKRKRTRAAERTFVCEASSLSWAKYYGGKGDITVQSMTWCSQVITWKINTNRHNFLWASWNLKYVLFSAAMY